jgi:hypothetical protein
MAPAKSRRHHHPLATVSAPRGCLDRSTLSLLQGVSAATRQSRGTRSVAARSKPSASKEAPGVSVPNAPPRYATAHARRACPCACRDRDRALGTTPRAPPRSDLRRWTLNLTSSSFFRFFESAKKKPRNYFDIIASRSRMTEKGSGTKHKVISESTPEIPFLSQPSQKQALWILYHFFFRHVTLRITATSAELGLGLGLGLGGV